MVSSLDADAGFPEGTLCSRFEKFHDGFLLRDHQAFFLGHFVIVTTQMQYAMDEEEAGFAIKRMAYILSIQPSILGADDHIAENLRWSIIIVVR